MGVCTHTDTHRHTLGHLYHFLLLDFNVGQSWNKLDVKLFFASSMLIKTQQAHKTPPL
jgi:hypothetical protein